MKYLATVLLICVGLTAHSQVLISLLFGDKLNSPNVEFGLEGGINYSNINGLESSSYVGNLNLGFYFNFRIKEQWYLNTGVLVKSSLGSANLTTNDLAITGNDVYFLDGVEVEGRYDQILNYFLVPIMPKYRFKNHFYVGAGVQTGLMTKAFIEFNSKKSAPQVRVRENNRDHFHRVDLGALAGVGYILRQGKGMTIGAKYYYGFFNVYKNLPSSNNSSIFAHVNIPIGAGPKE